VGRSSQPSLPPRALRWQWWLPDGRDTAAWILEAKSEAGLGVGNVANGSK
jgi:hypothetical protein